MENTTRIKVEQWLIENQDVLNIEGIERRAKITRGTIQKFLRYGRKINDKRIQSLTEVLVIIAGTISVKENNQQSSDLQSTNRFSY